MRNKTSSSLQKTYDECYLICSTAVYFEGQVSKDKSIASNFGPLICKYLALQWNNANNFNRATKQKPCDHGEPRSIKSTTTMPTVYQQVIFRGQRPKRHWRTVCEIWRCNAKNVWTYWRHSSSQDRRKQRLMQHPRSQLARYRRQFPKLQDKAPSWSTTREALLEVAPFLLLHTPNCRDPRLPHFQRDHLSCQRTAPNKQ